jgi:DNA-binding NtrC family response regulator
VLAELALRARPVALIASDQRMPEMTGVQMLEQAKQHALDAKLLLLTAYADTDVAIAAINSVGLDYYLQKPWDPPSERLYPVLDDLLDDWRQSHPPTPARCASSGTAGPTAATRSRPSSPATTCPTSGSRSTGTRRPTA